MEEEQRLGRIHKSIHGDGGANLQRILATCEQMLKDRGCAYVHRTSSGEPQLRGHGEEVGDIDVYVYTEEDKVGVKWVRSVLERPAFVVVISLEGPTPFTRKECDPQRIQFLLARDMCVNVTRHALVPKHERVDAPPPGISVAALPKILDTDPIVQYHNWPHGTVLRILRRFGGHEPVPYYRTVVPAEGC